MTSHELAARLREVADLIESRPDASIPDFRLSCMSHNKNSFLSVAKIFGGVKDASDKTFFYLRSKRGGLDIDLMTWRDEVCRLIVPAKPAVYDCEPLLSQAEEESIGI